MKRFAPVLFVLSLIMVGCQKARPTLPEPVAISGTILDAKGKPIANKVMVFLHPTDVNYTQEVKPVNAAKDEGKFDMKVRPGNYKVTLGPIPTIHGSGAPGSSGAPVGPGPEKGAPAALYPTEYGNDSTTPWKIEVKPGTNNPYTLQIGK
jgi:hypothetical protein